MRIFLIGFMGSGKTHWGKLLSGKLGLPFFDLDTVIVKTEQKSVSDIFTEKGEEYFRYKEKEVLEELVNDHLDFVLSCGGGTPCFFNMIDYMRKNGLVIWLNTSVSVLKNRLLRERMTRPLVRTVGDTELKSYIIRKLGERKMYYEQAHRMVQEDTLSMEGLIEILREYE